MTTREDKMRDLNQQLADRYELSLEEAAGILERQVSSAIRGARLVRRGLELAGRLLGAKL